MLILVDTSIWISHFKSPENHLIENLRRNLILSHSLVIGEILCGTPPNRQNTLRNLLKMRKAREAHLFEVNDFIEKHKAYGLGCGFIDMSLLVSTLITPSAKLWTKDKRLLKLAKRFNVEYEAPAS